MTSILLSIFLVSCIPAPTSAPVLPEPEHIRYGRLEVCGELPSALVNICGMTGFLMENCAADYSMVYLTGWESPEDTSTKDIYSPSDILVYTTAVTKTVWNISVYFPETESAEELSGQYEYVLRQAGLMYGEPEEVKETSVWFNRKEGAVSVEITKDGLVCMDIFDTRGVDLYFEEQKAAAL